VEVSFEERLAPDLCARLEFGRFTPLEFFSALRVVFPSAILRAREAVAWGPAQECWKISTRGFIPG